MWEGSLPARTLQRNTQSCSDVGDIFLHGAIGGNGGDIFLTGFTAPNRFGYGARIDRINI
ncbi:hypothetical protein STSP1_02034 [Sedimentisphaera salicampi]|uniref:Uncharacterized protein n=1 Tax=Sedimentisphaera salicampi TaxID=1941349 RepID=A0A1W6LPF9_9BACT|nr:hypothetical protein STSP1_02034 [Sedimentisphaera salicampi]